MTSSNGNIFRVTGPFSLILAWINDWENDRETGDLRRHRGHYDVNEMVKRINADLLKHFRKSVLAIKQFWVT